MAILRVADTLKIPSLTFVCNIAITSYIVRYNFGQLLNFSIGLFLDLYLRYRKGQASNPDKPEFFAFVRLSFHRCIKLCL